MKAAADLTINDGPGMLPTVSDIRADFERAITDTEKLRGSFPLTLSTVDTRCYENRETQALFVGFALGRRCAHRKASAYVKHVSGS